MAEESPLQTSNDTPPPSNNLGTLLALSPQTLEKDPSSIIDPILDDPQKTQLSSQQSPTNQLSNFHDYPLVNSNESLILGEFSGVDCNEILGFGESSGFLMSENEVGFEVDDEIRDSGSSKNGDVVAMELIDETVVVENVGKGKMVISHGEKMKYSTKELEKLRFVNVKSNKKFWQKVYNGFSDEVRNLYDGLGSFRKKNKQVSGKTNNFCHGILGDSSSENVVHDTRNSSHVTYNDDDAVDWSEDDKSDDEYYSIQRPAFMVEGEPDFESGPPEDGFEYLRRVRWEAAHIPKVKVVKLDDRRITEQSAYMPKIPDIEKCPPLFVPSRHWEDEFIAEFSDLRLAVSMFWDTDDANLEDADTIIFSRPVNTKHASKNLASIELPAGGPTLSTLVAMDPVTIVALLNKRISMFDSASNISKDDCAWLFALCAVVETPLDADTSASMRCLLRRCAKLRAEKDEFDDEVVMLNILVTIAGKIFGQSEN
ncbi:hypothetical protein RND81_14G073700 [Saponaria officinalis]|uniref:Gem-associated protein 2 n=1 Tax=Saponaria officinalis TaxID=3572 RepID=A0AAW1GTH8_SAPOF